MKTRLFSSLMSLALLAGCSNQVQPIYPTRIAPLVDTTEALCSFPKDDGNTKIITANGMLDVAAGAPAFLVGVEFVGEGLRLPGLTLMNGDELEPRSEGNNQARPQLTALRVRYELSRRLGDEPPAEFVTRISATSSTTAAEFIRLPVNLISAELATMLLSLNPSTEMTTDTVDVQVFLSADGEYAQSGQEFKTGEIQYPIRVFRSSPTVVCDKYERFPVSSSGLSSCRYVGQSYSQLSTPAPPSTCCSMMDPERC